MRDDEKRADLMRGFDAWSGSPLGLVVMTMLDDKLAVLDLYERYTGDGEMFLTGAFGGVKLFIQPIKGADPDDRSWRLYPAPRLQGVDRDRARPTSKMKSAPTGWAGVRERQSLTKTLAAVGMAAPFYQDELDLDDQP